MFMMKTFFLASLLGASGLAATLPKVQYLGSRETETGATCHNLTIPLSFKQTDNTTWTLQNYDVGYLDGLATFKLFRTATYNFRATYCVPANSNKDTILLLNHGGTFWRAMWDFPYEPETYSWVRAMHAAGYPTFAYDQIGCGESDRPDGLFDVHAELTVQSNKQMAALLKSGGVGGKAYKKIGYTGFSSGSVTGISMAARYPDAVDALILIGFTWNREWGYPGYISGLQAPVNTIANRPDWKNVSSLYQSQATLLGRKASVFYGDYDKMVLDADFALRDMDSVGLALSFGFHQVNVPDFTGPVFIGDGNQDSSFCGIRCGSAPYLAYDNIPKASDHDLNVYDQAGHGVFLHKCAKKLQNDVVAFLKRNNV